MTRLAPSSRKCSPTRRRARGRLDDRRCACVAERAARADEPDPRRGACARRRPSSSRAGGRCRPGRARRVGLGGDARSRLGRAGRGAAVRGRCEPRSLAVPGVRAPVRFRRPLPARRHRDRAARRGARPGGASDRCPRGHRLGRHGARGSRSYGRSRGALDDTEADGLARTHDSRRAPRSRRAHSGHRDRDLHRPDARAGRDGDDGDDAVRALRPRAGRGRDRGRLRRPQHPPDRLQEPGRPPVPAGHGREVRRVVLAAGERDLPLHPLRALRDTGQDARRRGQPHDAVGLGRDDRDRRRRPRRRRLHGRASVRAAVPEDRRRLPRERAAAALDPGEGRDPRAAAPARRARRAGRDLRVHRAGRDDASLHRARDDREHDRRARRDRRRVPGRRRDEALVRRAGALARTSPSWPPATRRTTSTRSRRSTSRRSSRSSRSRRARATSSRSTSSSGTPLAQVCVGSSVNSSYEDMAVCGAVLRGNRLSEKLDLGDRDARLAADPRPDHAVGHLRRAAVGGRPDARAGLRAVRRHGPGASLGRELAAHVQPELPGTQRNGRRQRLPLLPGGRGRLDAEGRDLRPARADTARAARAPARATGGRPGAHPGAGPGRRGAGRSRSRAARTSSRRPSRRSCPTRSSCAS